MRSSHRLIPVLALALLLAGCRFEFPRLLGDDTFEDFRAGAFDDSGARALVAVRGSLQLVDRLDLDQDGWADLVFCSRPPDNSSGEVKSYVFWGGPAGFDQSRLTSLPTQKARANLIADLDDDGYPDIVVANEEDLTGQSKIDSVIYPGSPLGYSSSSMARLPTTGARGVASADLDGDGHLDLVFANSYLEARGHVYSSRVESYVYWGSAAGFAVARRTGLPTIGASGVAIADLDADGHLDLVFANLADGDRCSVDSYIYWGSTDGFSVGQRSALPTVGASFVTVADLDRDGHLDLLISGFTDKFGTAGTLDSHIYWGDGARRFSADRRTALPSRGAIGTSVADLDADGHLDVIVSNANGNTPSYVYWGRGHRSFDGPLELSAQRSHGNLAADLDQDGHLDLVLANEGGTSTVYWGPFSHARAGQPLRWTDLETPSASISTGADPGSIADRRPEQAFISRALDSGSDSPEYGLLAWAGKVPPGTSIRLQLRSASSPEELSRAPWQGPGSTHDYYETSPAYINREQHRGHRFIQYRALLGSRFFTTTPVLDRVTVSCY